jgi:hypothetical protein
MTEDLGFGQLDSMQVPLTCLSHHSSLSRLKGYECGENEEFTEN